MTRTTIIIIIIILTLLLFSTVSVAQEHNERTAPPQRPPQKQTEPQSQPPERLRYTSPEGRYTVLLPAQPTLSTQNVSAPDGTPLTQHMAQVADVSALLMMSYFDYGTNVKFSLDKSRDGMVNSIKGTLLDEQSISLGGAQGRQIKVAGRAEAIEFILRARVYDVKPRVYILQCIYPKSGGGPATDQRCEQFFDSFKVLTTP